MNTTKLALVWRPTLIMLTITLASCGAGRTGHSSLLESNASCTAFAEAVRLMSLVNEGVSARMQMHPLVPVQPSQLPSLVELDRIKTLTEGCSNKEAGVAKDYLQRFSKYIQKFESATADNKDDGAFEILKNPPNARSGEGRPRVAVLDVGFSLRGVGEAIPSLGQSTPVGKTSFLVPLDLSLPWDIGDLDPNPTTQHPHGSMVIDNFIFSRFSPASLGTKMPLEDVPVVLPIKIHNFYDRTSLPQVATEQAGLVDLLTRAAPSVINMSGAFGIAREDFDQVRPFRDYLEAHTELIMVAAIGQDCGYLGGDCWFQPFPSGFTDNAGHRLKNLVNVGTAFFLGGDGLVITSNFEDGLVDVFVVSDDNQTSFAAPRIARLITYVQTNFKKCFATQTPREFLGKLSQQRARGGQMQDGTWRVVNQPALEIEKLTAEDVRRACQ
jgi:hypothetical protein